jgi:ribosome-associated toxin RatA of RatAB toxin-antitoxin module
MNDHILNPKTIEKLKPRRAYLIAKKLNETYAFFTGENLVNGPNETLEILWEYSKRPKRITMLDLEYQREFDSMIVKAQKGEDIAEILERIARLNRQIEHEFKNIG